MTSETTKEKPCPVCTMTSRLYGAGYCSVECGRAARLTKSLEELKGVLIEIKHEFRKWAELKG